MATYADSKNIIKRKVSNYLFGGQMLLKILFHHSISTDKLKYNLHTNLQYRICTATPPHLWVCTALFIKNMPFSASEYSQVLIAHRKAWPQSLGPR